MKKEEEVFLPGDSEHTGTLRFRSQAPISPPIYHTRWRRHSVPFDTD